MDILIGNSFPFSLITRDVDVRCVSLDAARKAFAGADVHSFWGHSGTVAAASAFLGVDVRPKAERPPVVLSSDGFPTLDGITFSSCYICSPIYRKGYRPAIGAEASAADILDWRLLRVDWIKSRLLNSEV